METNEHYKFEDRIEVKSDEFDKDEFAEKLFISSYSDYRDSNSYPNEKCNDEASVPTLSVSRSNSSFNLEDLEENFSTLFQSSHECDEYSTGFVRMLYMKYLSNMSIQIDNLKLAQPSIKRKVPDKTVAQTLVLSNGANEAKKQLPEDHVNKLKKIKSIPILSKGVFTAHVMQDGTIGLGSWGNNLYLYNPKTEETIEVPGNSGWVKYIIPLDNNRIASCSEDSTLKIWDSQTYECLGEFKADFATNGLMSITQLSTNEIICGSSDGFLFIWDIKRKIIVDSIQASSSGVFVIMIINANQLMIGSFDDHINIFEIKPNLSQIGKIEGHTGWAKPLLRFRSHDLITTGEDGILKLWDLDTLNCYHTLYGHKGGIWSGVVKNDSVLFTGSSDCTIRIWNLHTYQCMTVISELSTVTALIELPGNELIAGTFNNELTLYKFY